MKIIVSIIILIVIIFMANVEQKIIELEREIQELKEEKGQLVYPFTDETTKLLRDFLNEEIIDAVWNNYFYMYSHFEANEGIGYDSLSGGGCSPNGLTMYSSEISGVNEYSSAGFNNPPVDLNNVFETETRVRFQVAIQEHRGYYFVFSVGGKEKEWNPKHYGIIIEDGKIYASASNGVGILKHYLMDIISDPALDNMHNYDVEIKFYPKDRIEFWISDGYITDKEFLKLRLVVRDRLVMPEGSFERIGNYFWLHYYFLSTDGNFQTAYITYLEYLQKKSIPIVL